MIAKVLTQPMGIPGAALPEDAFIVRLEAVARYVRTNPLGFTAAAPTGDWRARSTGWPGRHGPAPSR
ncbi:hypothetical protein ACIBBB_34830 [Streptomyces sp. NPDC051217]|uniref:hypothetical protein n=1 Tax=Streptomyces sp. NPDC051217 TaxID=3365644 RepID=UPI0037B1E98C